MNTIITLINGIKVKIWSDNEDCTLQVFDADQIYDSESTYLETINYSIVSPEDRKKLAFYRKNS